MKEVTISNEKSTRRVEKRGQQTVVKHTDNWIVRATTDDDLIEHAIFHGYRAEKRARVYAITEYGGTWDYRQLFKVFPGKYAVSGLTPEELNAEDWIEFVDIDELARLGVKTTLFAKLQRRIDDTSPWEDTGLYFNVAFRETE